jgi:cation transport protein ChaC
MSPDPFRHHPELRALIRDPASSPLRALDYEALDQRVAADGGPPDWRRDEAFQRALRARTLEGRWDRDLWVFAYGSLIWDPAFHFTEVRTARVFGYRRRFCLETILGRGTPDCPGLVAGLDPGGECSGLAFRLARETLETETWVLWRREFLLPSYVPRFVGAMTAQGPIEALTCVVDPTAPNYRPDLEESEMVGMLATARGFLGSSLEYVESLAENLTAAGLTDPALNRICALAQQVASDTRPGTSKERT